MVLVQVFPTQVGVIPENGTKHVISYSIPHASGGDPKGAKFIVVKVGYSPRKWG